MQLRDEHPPFIAAIYGADDRIRTCNLVITSDLRYRCATSASYVQSPPTAFLTTFNHHKGKEASISEPDCDKRRAMHGGSQSTPFIMNKSNETQ